MKHSCNVNIRYLENVFNNVMCGIRLEKTRNTFETVAPEAHRDVEVTVLNLSNNKGGGGCVNRKY